MQQHFASEALGELIIDIVKASGSKNAWKMGKREVKQRGQHSEQSLLLVAHSIVPMQWIKLQVAISQQQACPCPEAYHCVHIFSQQL